MSQRHRGTQNYVYVCLVFTGRKQWCSVQGHRFAPRGAVPYSGKCPFDLCCVYSMEKPRPVPQGSGRASAASLQHNQAHCSKTGHSSFSAGWVVGLRKEQNIFLKKWNWIIPSCQLYSGIQYHLIPALDLTIHSLMVWLFFRQSNGTHFRVWGFFCFNQCVRLMCRLNTDACMVFCMTFRAERLLHLQHFILRVDTPSLFEIQGYKALCGRAWCSEHKLLLNLHNQAEAGHWQTLLQSLRCTLPSTESPRHGNSVSFLRQDPHWCP